MSAATSSVQAPIIISILYPDDNPINHKIFTRVMGIFNKFLNASQSPFRFSCDHAMSGEEAVEMFQRSLKSGHPYHIVITDYNMIGNFTGVVTARAIKNLIHPAPEGKTLMIEPFRSRVPMIDPNLPETPSAAAPSSCITSAKSPMSRDVSLSAPPPEGFTYPSGVTEFEVTAENIELPLIMVYSTETEAGRMKVEAECREDGSVIAFLPKETHDLFGEITRIFLKYRKDVVLPAPAPQMGASADAEAHFQ
jgi:CheY-like chemotaxis protein